MILDGNKIKRIQRRYDLVIVGAGTIGLYLAHIINKKNPDIKIALIESGSEEPTTKFNLSLSETRGKDHRGTLNGRASGIGGTSHLWGGQLAEFEKNDFDDCDSKWPISYKEILPYYEKVYKVLDLQNFMTNKSYDRVYGKLNEASNEIERIYTRWLVEPNFYNFFKSDIQKNKNISIIKNTTANNIEFKNQEAVSIKCVTNDSINISIEADKFIFASGTIGVNQFFLSTKHQNKVPWKNNENIGKYFQDHLGSVIGTIDIKNKKLFRKLFENSWINGVKVQPKLKLASKDKSIYKSGAVAFFTFNSKYEASLSNIKNTVKNLGKKFNLKDLSALFVDIFFIRRDLIQLIYKFLFKKRIHAVIESKESVEINIHSEQIPLENSRIEIDTNQALDNGLFKASTHWSCNSAETESIRKIGKEVNSLLIKNGIGEIVFINNFFGMSNKEFIGCFHDTNHQCGGLIMSVNEKYGVVDKDCKVWGTNNIWVAGSAIFPSSSYANSTLTALALAHKLSEHCFE